jgi:RND family efflux transporter MFP subunit
MFVFKKRYVFPIALLIIVTCSFVGCSSKSDSPSSDTAQSSDRLAPAVWVAAVEYGNLEETIQGTGTLEGWEDISILAKVSGTVTKINARLGDRLEKEQSILEIEPEVQELRLAQAEAVLLQAEANYQTSSADLARYETLFKQGDISQMEIEAARAAEMNNLGMLRSAEAAVELAKRAVTDSRVGVPTDGYLASLDVEEGELVSPGTPICRVVQLSPLKLALELTEQEIIHIKKNQKVRIEPDAFPDMIVFGVVHRVGVAADRNSRLFPVEIQISQFPEVLKPGMVVRAYIILKEHRDIVVIPKNSLIKTESGFHVFVIDDASIAHKTTVSIGAEDTKNVVVESGLQVNSKFVIRGQQILDDGVKVRIETPRKGQ